MNEENQPNALSGEKKISLSPVSDDMRALSDQRAVELAKPFDNEEVQDQPENPASEIQAQETNTYIDPLENFTAQSQDLAPQPQPQTQNIYPEPTTPTYNTPAPQTTQPQGASYIELIEDKSAQLKEKWSIALGFGTLPVGFTAIFLALYVAFSALSAMFSSLGSSSPASTSTLAQIASIAFWVLLAGTIAMPIVGFILGQKYEKATGKISSGKIMSIVSGSVVAVFIAISIANHFQQQAQKAEYEKKYNNYTNSSSLYR